MDAQKKLIELEGQLAAAEQLAAPARRGFAAGLVVFSCSVWMTRPLGPDLAQRYTQLANRARRIRDVSLALADRECAYA